MNADTECLACCREKSRGASGAVQGVRANTAYCAWKSGSVLKSDRIERMAAPVIMAEILSIVDEKVEIANAIMKSRKSSITRNCWEWKTLSWQI